MKAHPRERRQLCMSYMLVCTLWLAVAFCSAQYGLQLGHHMTEGFSMPCASLHLIVGEMQHEDADRPDSPSCKKQRHVWTSEAHNEFSNID